MPTVRLNKWNKQDGFDLMIQLQRVCVWWGGVGGGLGGVGDTNYLYPARWGWIKNTSSMTTPAYITFTYFIPSISHKKVSN